MKPLEKVKIVLEGTALTAKNNNNASRSGVYFLMKNICDHLYRRDDVELKIFFQYPDQINQQQIKDCFGGTYLIECLDTSTIKVGEDSLNLLMFHEPANINLHNILPDFRIFQVIHDLAYHCCNELIPQKQYTWFIEFEKRIIDSINPKSYVLCVSENTKKDLINLTNFHPERTEVFYPGIKVELNPRFLEEITLSDIKSKIKLPESAKYILALSTICPRKNFQTVLNIIDAITARNPELNLYLIIAGDWGGDENFWKSLSLKNKDKARFVGYVSDEFLPHLYSGAVCLLYPSFYEGFGMPLIEAMSYGTPVVTSNRGSIPEVVGPDVETFDAYDVAGMANKIVNWCRNPDQRNIDGQIAKERSKFFTWDKAVDKIVEFIKSKQ
jgi:glycosyltransferase involved in cell wall biosynthesis